MAKKTFIIRADGSDTIGYGHIFRTLVLSKKLKENGCTVKYLSRKLQGFPAKRIEDEGFEIIWVPDEKPFAAELGLVSETVKREKPDWFVIDNYSADRDYYAAVKKYGVKVMVIDDINHTEFPVDLLFNQNINAGEVEYRCGRDTVKLLGPEYALIGGVYAKERGKAVIRENLRNIFVFMGGADSENQTLKILEGIKLSNIQVAVDVALGAANRYISEVEKYAAENLPLCRVQCEMTDLTRPMLKSDISFGAGGSVCWEMCMLKLPMLLMPTADNQRPNAQGLDKAGAAINLGWWQNVTPRDIAKVLKGLSSGKIRDMSEKAATICDGEGAQRTVEYLVNK